MDRELLIEIGTEEIPASWLPSLTTAFGATLEASLKASRLTADAPVETFFASLKRDLVHDELYATRDVARASIF